mmetsp:Transcript_24707/g.60781  ORF Transcript_24707/g.60781 Transcript_24707/m.60781 type:complete len:321 (+) Transcript_24707:222-1184(+)
MTCAISGGAMLICSTTSGTLMTSCTGGGGGGSRSGMVPFMDGSDPMLVRNVESTVRVRGSGMGFGFGFSLSCSCRILMAAARLSLSFSSSACFSASTSASTAVRSDTRPAAAMRNFFSSTSLLRDTTVMRCSISFTFSSAAAIFSPATAAFFSSANTVSGSFSSFFTMVSSDDTLSVSLEICDCCVVMVRSCVAHCALNLVTRAFWHLASSISARIFGGTSEPCRVSKSMAVAAPPLLPGPCSKRRLMDSKTCFCSLAFCSSRPRFSAMVSTSWMYSVMPWMRSPARKARAVDVRLFCFVGAGPSPLGLSIRASLRRLVP